VITLSRPYLMITLNYKLVIMNKLSWFFVTDFDIIDYYKVFRLKVSFYQDFLKTLITKSTFFKESVHIK
jgi:hypothetical protein